MNSIFAIWILVAGAGICGIALGFSVVASRVNTIEEVLEIETLTVFVFTVASHHSMREHVFDDGYLVYLLLVFLSTSVFFNFGGLLALLYAKYKQREMGGD